MKTDAHSKSLSARRGVEARVRQGVERAASTLSAETSGHIERILVRVRRGATSDELAEAIADAARRAGDRSR